MPAAKPRLAFAPVMASPVLRRLLPVFAVSAIGDGMSAVGVAWLAIRIASPADRGLVVGVAVAVARSRPLAGLLTLTVVYFFLYGPVEVALPLYVTGPLRGSAGLLGLFWTVFGIGATAGSITAGLARRLPVWPVLVASVIGWGAALAPMGLLRLPVPALACFAAGGVLYAPYPALSATLFQRESPPELLSQVLAARGALTVLAAPLGTALGGPLTAWLGAQHTLLVSAAATIASGMAATGILTARRRELARKEGRVRPAPPGQAATGTR
jgi:hypothetical protein